MTSQPDGVPIATGELDAEYFRAALGRAGQPNDVLPLERAPLSGGRQNPNVTSVEVVNPGGKRTSYVVKPNPRTGWITDGIGEVVGEAQLWLSGTTRSLPAPLSCPTLDVALHEERDEWWILMEDVSRGIAGRGQFGEEQVRTLLRALAPLHARYWGRDDELAELPVGSLEAATRVFVEPTYHAARPDEPRPRWVQQAIDRVWVIRQFAPVFIDFIDPADADFYLDLCKNREPWLRPLASGPMTLVHGDLRRANMAFLPDKVSLFDWELATRAPAACDLQWLWLLSFWAYPPDDGCGVAHREPLRQEYVACLEAALGRPIDREAFDASWDLAWLRALAQIGFSLVDPVTSPGHSAEDVARTRRVCTEAFTLARRVYDRRVR